MAHCAIAESLAAISLARPSSFLSSLSEPCIGLSSGASLRSLRARAAASAMATMSPSFSSWSVPSSLGSHLLQSTRFPSSFFPGEGRVVRHQGQGFCDVGSIHHRQSVRTRCALSDKAQTTATATEEKKSAEEINGEEVNGLAAANAFGRNIGVEEGNGLVHPDSGLTAVSASSEGEEEDEEFLEGTVLGIFPWMTPRVQGLILINLMTMIYGTNMVVVKISETSDDVDPSLFTLARFMVAAIAFSPTLPQAFKKPAVAKAGAELGFWAALGYGCQAIGLLSCEASRASFISTFTVIVVPFLAAFFGKRIQSVTWISAMTALVGVGLLEQGGSDPSFGDLWTATSAFFFAVHIVRSEHYSKTVNKSGKYATPLIGMQLAATALCALLWVSQGPEFAAAVDVVKTGGMETVIHHLQHAPWLALVYTGLASTAFCLWVEMSALRYVSSTDAALIYTSEPVYGAALAYFALGERWGPKGWVGAALILASCAAAQYFREEDEDDEVHPDHELHKKEH